MLNIIAWAEMHQEQIMTGGFLAVQGLMLLLLLVVAHRVKTVKRQIKSITAQVEHYLKVVLDTEDAQMMEKPGQKRPENNREEEENRLISAVLKEIFP